MAAAIANPPARIIRDRRRASRSAVRGPGVAAWGTAARPSKSTARPSATIANGLLPISFARFCGASAVTSTPRTWFDPDDEEDPAAADLPSTAVGPKPREDENENDVVAPQTLRFLAAATAEGEPTTESKIAMVTRSNLPRLVRSPI